MVGITLGIVLVVAGVITGVEEASKLSVDAHAIVILLLISSGFICLSIGGGRIK